MRNLLPWQRALIHTLLFALTLFTTILAGAELYTGKSWWGELSWDVWPSGIPYALAFLIFLTCHEFGHYFAAIHHQVRTSLPFFIPLYIPGLVNIGSLGAVIALQEVPRTPRQFFDIGIAGPLAGIVASLSILAIGIWTLPDPQGFLLEIYPEWQGLFGGIPTETELEAHLLAEQDVKIVTGSSLLFSGLLTWGTAGTELLPPDFALIHYPLIFAGFLTLFATALNLLPIGQLDGGHITYAMFGRKTAGIISRITVLGLLITGGTGLLSFQDMSWLGGMELLAYLAFVFYVMMKVFDQSPLPLVGLLAALMFCLQLFLHRLFPDIEPQYIWLLYTLMVVRVIKLDHPPAYEAHALNLPRRILGWFALAIFILCFTPAPLRLIGDSSIQWMW